MNTKKQSAPVEQRIRLATSPYNYWWRDLPLPEKYKPTPDTMLGQMQQAGFVGTEVGDGSILPLEPDELKTMLAKHNMALAGGFWPTYLLTKPYSEQEKEFAGALQILAQMNADVVMVADFSYSLTGSLAEGVLSGRIPRLKSGDWKKLCAALAKFQKMANDQGLKFGYHPHVGTIIVDVSQIERLLDGAPDLTLNLDTGHLAMVGENPLNAVNKFIDRTVHFHFKSIRQEVVKRVKKYGLSWQWSKVNGAFTAVGDGKVDFRPIISRVKESSYQGWITLEIEQDPHKYDPFLYEKLSRDYLKEVAGW